MRRPWLKFSLLVLLLVSIVFIGSKHTVWASSEAAPLGQTVPTRPPSTPSQPPAGPAPTGTRIPRPLIATATHTLTVTTLKPAPTNANPATPAVTFTRPAVTIAATVIMTATSKGSLDTPVPQQTSASRNRMVVPAAGGLLLTLLGVLAVIIWRKRTH